MTIHAVQPQPARQRIIALLVSMGLKVEQALDQSITALLHSQTHAAAGVVENVLAIQELEAAVDHAVFGALQSGELPSSDVAHTTSVVNISKALSRLAKLAASLGSKVGQVGEHCDQEDFSRLQPLAIAVSHLCRQTLRALSHHDPVLARNAAAGSTTVDAYRDYVFRELRDPAHTTTGQSMHLLFASRCLEQIADHASELAENLVIFLGAGATLRCSSPDNRRRAAC
jgi:phosphate transport system protein